MSGFRKTGDLPGQKGDIAAAIQQFVSQGLVDLDVMLPAMVESYDRVKNIATVRPMIAVVNNNKFTEKRHNLVNIPVFALGGGGFVVNFPLKQGDLGWIIAADRDLTEYKERLRDVAPKTSRSHSFSDGQFMPDKMRNYTIKSDHSDRMVIQNTAGDTVIAVGEGVIYLDATQKVVVRVPDTEFQSNVRITKNLVVDGASTLKDTTVNDIQVSGHTHTETGSTTGPMK